MNSNTMPTTTPAELRAWARARRIELHAGYQPCAERTIPAGVRFDVPGHCQGQMVEVAYGGWDRGEHGPGDPYMRVTDQSLSVGDPQRTIWYRNER